MVSPDAAEVRSGAAIYPSRDWRLHKHADYQRVYQSSRKQFSSLMTYFASRQPAGFASAGPRIGITAGKVLGKAVERNRIKRRMRAAIVSNLDVLCAEVDVVLHPKRSVLDAEWAALASDVRRVFEKVQRTAGEGGAQVSGSGVSTSRSSSGVSSNEKKRR